MTDESTKEEILVNVTAREVRAALLENGILQEVYVERTTRRGLISNIYKGRISRVLPGMQAAFVDIGLERTAFLHASGIVQRDGENGDAQLPDIRELIREGEEVLVQVVKDPLGTKGARLTTFITLPSRFLVLLPAGTGVGVSARIEDEEERDRLRNIVTDLLDEDADGEGGVWAAAVLTTMPLVLWEGSTSVRTSTSWPTATLATEASGTSMRVLIQYRYPMFEKKNQSVGQPYILVYQYAVPISIPIDCPR